jgi:hypothetical protein
MCMVVAALAAAFDACCALLLCALSRSLSQAAVHVRYGGGPQHRSMHSSCRSGSSRLGSLLQSLLLCCLKGPRESEGSSRIEGERARAGSRV